MFHNGKELIHQGLTKHKKTLEEEGKKLQGSSDPTLQTHGENLVDRSNNLENKSTINKHLK